MRTEFILNCLINAIKSVHFAIIELKRKIKYNIVKCPIINWSVVVMIDTAASVLAKLRNKAKASGISYQQCLQLFVQEEFLRKLSHVKVINSTKFRDIKIIYKFIG